MKPKPRKTQPSRPATRKPAESALREHSLLLDSAQRIGRMGTWSLDVRKNRLNWSESTCNLFGLKPSEFKGTFEHFCSFILPEDLPAYTAAHARVSPAHPLLEAEYRIRRPDGSIRSLYERGNVTFDAAGAAISWLGVVMDVTELLETRERLSQSAALLRIAGKAARLGGWAIELPGHNLIWSDETCLIHDLPPGYHPTLEEGISMFPPESRVEVARLVEICIRDGTPYDFETTKLTAKGRLIWVRSIGEAVRNEEGKIIRLQGAFQDITDRKRVELELARSNRALRLLSSCDEALLQSSAEPQLLQEICRLAVSSGGYLMAWVGYALEDENQTIQPMAHAGMELDYLSVARLNWSERDLAGRGPASQAIRTGQVSCCADVTAKDAPIYWREAALSRGYKSIICLPLRGEHRTFGMLGLYSGEISQPSPDELKLLQQLADDLAFGIINLRTRAERHVAQQKIIQQAELIDKATDAIFVRDLEQKVSFWNQGAERIYGWKAGEVIGRSTRELFCPDPFVFEKASRELRRSGEWIGELQIKNKAGQAITLDCRWTLVRDNQGAPVSILSIETDITEKKKMEAWLLRNQRMESLGTLAGGIAHDLNNVLSPIMMSIGMLKQDYRTPETRRMLETLETCSKRAADLVRQVLSFARGIEGQRVTVNLTQLARELQRVIREVFPKNIETELIGANDLSTVTGDPSQLHQVLLNLCVNARDAMPQGGKLTMTMENVVLDETFVAMNPDAKTGAYVLVSVTDTGAGIEPAIRDRIFEPFFTTKDTGKGTGLGLSTVLGIVKSHGGFIHVHSEPGQGTKFKVYLPADAAKAAPDQANREHATFPRGNGELILLVDDELSILNVTQKILELFGYSVLTAANGEEAAALYTRQQNEIAVVLTDISMPVMDGPALIIALKTINPHVRIIASSGLANNDVVARATGNGITHFIPKPYKAETLLKILRAELTGPSPESPV
jgi:PAS domain S-box-containing protein